MRIEEEKKRAVFPDSFVLCCILRKLNIKEIFTWRDYKWSVKGVELG